jgi:predicted Zn-dependent protease
MQSGPRSGSSVNGVPAASADFRFTSEDGVLDGRVVFLEHRGTILRFLGYGPSQAWANRREVDQRSLASFLVLRDREFLDVQPARIRVVTVPRDIGLDSLLAREGAGEWAEEVRLLNRIQGNPTLPAGRAVKIPVGGDLPGGF